MPFTPAHAAAALPFLRTRLVLSALIVGTLAPDFEYFLRLAPGGGFGHTLAGAFLFSLPLALVILWMFHVLVKAPLLRLFPDALRRRIPAERFRFGGPSRFMLIVGSALVGIFTHIVWDSFTHSYMWPARHFPWLNEKQSLPLVGPVEHCALLQQASTITGLAILGFWLVRWYRNTALIYGATEVPMSAERRWLVLGGVVGVACGGTLLRALLVAYTPGLTHKWATVLGDSAATVIALAWWALVLYSIAFRVAESQAEA